MFAEPSAVTGYDDTHADLLNYSGGSYQYLSANSGLIRLIDCAATTTATETVAGNAAGYEQDVKIEQGQAGTPILQESWQYFNHTAGWITVDPAWRRRPASASTSAALPIRILRRHGGRRNRRHGNGCCNFEEW